MWAQLMTMTVNAGRDVDLPGLLEKLHEGEQEGSGLLRTMVFQDQSDPTVIRVLVLFESEEKARAREQDPRREQALESARALMREVFAGPPEFVNLNVLEDVAN